MRTENAKPACSRKHGLCRPSGAAAQLRGRRPHAELHPGRRRVVPHPVGGQPPDPAARSQPGRAAVRAPAPRAGPDRGRRACCSAPWSTAWSGCATPRRACAPRRRRARSAVTCTPGFASLWLIPRLAHFTAAHPEVDVRLSATLEVLDLERARLDLAVRFVPISRGSRRRAVRGIGGADVRAATGAVVANAGRSRGSDPADHRGPPSGRGADRRLGAMAGGHGPDRPAHEEHAALHPLRGRGRGCGRRPGRRDRPPAAAATSCCRTAAWSRPSARAPLRSAATSSRPPAAPRGNADAQDFVRWLRAEAEAMRRARLDLNPAAAPCRPRGSRRCSGRRWRWSPSRCRPWRR